MSSRIIRRDSTLSFACVRCGRCCHDQAIQLNGYEIARLARGLGLCTAETIARYTTGGGQFLRFDGDGACGLLRAKGCAVHADRPLACRLYPLGRELDETGRESFVPLTPHPLCAGQVEPPVTPQVGPAAEATIAHFLEGQGAGPFLLAFDLYQEAALRFLALPAPARASAVRRLEWFNQDLALANGGLDVLPLEPWRKLEMHLDCLALIMGQAESEAPPPA